MAPQLSVISIVLNPKCREEIFQRPFWTPEVRQTRVSQAARVRHLGFLADGTWTSEVLDAELVRGLTVSSLCKRSQIQRRTFRSCIPILSVEAFPPQPFESHLLVVHAPFRLCGISAEVSSSVGT